MPNLTVSTPELVYTPEGNGLALFIDSRDDIMKVKDARAQFAPLSDYINFSTNFKYGSFYSTSNQAATVINTPKVMTLNNTDISNGVSIVSNSQITVNTAGLYNLQFSAQIDRVVGSGTDIIDIWLRKQGVDVSNTNGKVTISGSVNQSKLIASWNLFIVLNAGEYVELVYSVTDLQVQLIYEAANLTVPHPATPSLIVTMNKIS
jgi:hypothetical protein